MKKFICLVLSVFIVLSCICVSTMAAEDISVVINGKEQNYDVMPVIVDGRTLVPMRAIFESLGAKVGWIEHSKTVTGTRNGKTVKLRIGDNLAYISGDETILDVPATIIGGRTMVPVRFVSEMLGESVGWDTETKTVIIDSEYLKNVAIQDTLAPLTNNIHRNIPTTFKRSSSYDDIIYYDDNYSEIKFYNESEIKDILSKAKVLADTDSLANAVIQGDKDICVSEKLTQDGESVVRFTLNKDISATSKCIYNFKKLEGVNDGDTVLLSFDIRVAESTNDGHFCQVQLQENISGKYNKIIWEKVNPSKEWKRVYMRATATKDHTDLGFRPGMYKGVVEVKNFLLYNLGTDVTTDQLRALNYPLNYEDHTRDAQWRKEALDRIEKHRKGDFKVIVKDSKGNVIPDAQVEFDMFESEYLFGTTFGATTNKTKNEKFNTYFNTAVHSHNLKWGPYTENPKKAREDLNHAKKMGVKHFRGHAIVWERAIGSDGKTYLVPPFVLKEDNTVIDDKELLQKYIKEWTYQVTDEFAGEIDEWDVVNEICEKFLFRGKHGDDMLFDWFRWANEGATESIMVYNDFAHMYQYAGEGSYRYDNLLKYAKMFKDNNVDIQAIGMQSHMELYANKGKDRLNSLKEHYDVFRTLADLGYKLSVTEYSMDNIDQYYQAEYTRDYYILAFSVPEMYGFTMWGFADGNAFASESIMFDEKWNMKKAGEMLEDLIYNKFWTRDARATTGADGMASIRGFYGDYDVTVNANGKTKTVSCAYHKGYDNVLEIVID